MNPLDNLKDIQNPSEIGNWPPAYGWWLLAIVSMLIIYLTIKWAINFKQQRKAKKQALAEIDSIELTDKNVTTELNQILKRVALAYFPNISVQKLHGKQWVKFLVDAMPSKFTDQSNEQLTQLQNSLYQNQTVEMSEIIQHKKAVQQWIKYATPPRQKIIQTMERKHA